MKSFVIKIVLFFIPFIIGGVIYLSLDPFKVLRNYDEYYDANAIGRVVLDKDYVSTTNFDNHNPKEKYNSFIFGNSRSMFYQISDWKKHIEPSSKCYHFDAAGETIYSLHKKVKYLENNNVPIKNAIVILDFETLSKTTPNKGHLGAISPQLINQKNILEFHYTFIEAFFNMKFMYAYFDFKITNKIKPYMKKGALIDDSAISYDNITNELQFKGYDNLIAENKYYTKERRAVFYERDSVLSFSNPIIGHSQKEILKDILNVFSKNNTNYKIIINPLYDQKKFAQEDLSYLKSLFNAKNVFDYSGINEITNDYTNYYEVSHYLPRITKGILNDIYDNKIKPTDN